MSLAGSGSNVATALTLLVSMVLLVVVALVARHRHVMPPPPPPPSLHQRHRRDVSTSPRPPPAAAAAAAASASGADNHYVPLYEQLVETRNAAAANWDMSRDYEEDYSDVEDDEETVKQTDRQTSDHANNSSVLPRGKELSGGGYTADMVDDGQTFDDDQYETTFITPGMHYGDNVEIVEQVYLSVQLSSAHLAQLVSATENCVASQHTIQFAVPETSHTALRSDETRIAWQSLAYSPLGAVVSPPSEYL